MSKKECRKLVCVLALSLLMAMPGNGIAQMASASNSITTLSVEKNEQDVAVLQKIIATQSGKNTTISENLNDSKQYTWENGRLVGINWSDEDNIYWWQRDDWCYIICRIIGIKAVKLFR